MLSRDVTWPFSFENICVILGFDADCLRRWLLRDAPTVESMPQASSGLVRGGGMVRAVRAARMRGNQQKKPLRVRRRSSPSTQLPRPTGVVWNEGRP
jgi:hypothetical protein